MKSKTQVFIAMVIVATAFTAFAHAEWRIAPSLHGSYWEEESKSTLVEHRKTAWLYAQLGINTEGLKGTANAYRELGKQRIESAVPFVHAPGTLTSDLSGYNLPLAEAPVTLGSSATTNAIPWMRNPSRLSPREQELLNLREYYIRLAQISRNHLALDDAFQYDNKVLRIDAELRRLESVRALHDLNFGQPAIASKIWSEAIGQRVHIQPVSNGTFYVWFDGGEKQNVTKEQLIRYLAPFIER